MLVRLHLQIASHRLFVATRGPPVLRECWQDYIRYAGGSNPQLGNQCGYVLPLLSRAF